MSFWHVLYLLIIYPLQLFFELVFSVAYKGIGNYGYAIICLSLVINIVVLPLYLRADKIQKEQRVIEGKLGPGISHIRKAFKGDERFMMLQMFYKINHYHPAMSLRSATSLLLEIPFFMAAYNMLSSLRWLNGVPFWFIKDLGQPDSLFTIGSFSVNVLPIAMTLINILSSAFYTRGASKREKVQVYGMAAIFLVLLYNSPSGLAFYWTLNNVFSLFKNIVMLVIEEYVPNFLSSSKKRFTALMRLVTPSNRQSLWMFILSSLISALLLSFCIPLMLIAASVEEFVEPMTYGNPVQYIWPSICIALGIFIVWGSIIYGLLDSKGRRIFSILSVGLALFFCANFFYEPTLMEMAPAFIPKALTYTVVMIASLILMAVIFNYSKFIYNTILVATLIGVFGMGVAGVYNVNKIYDDISFPPLGEELTINLSSEGDNVIVIMLDRALGVTAEDEFEMIPGLRERFDGFTFAPNTISYGAHTNFGSPALLGGYDYTPYMINQRDSESLSDKQNEALRVLPLIFSNENYDITVVNPPYAGYQYLSDTSIFSDIPNTRAYYVDNLFNDYSEYLGESTNEIRERDLFFFGLSYAMVYGRDFFFDNGNYNNPNRDYFINYNFNQFLDVKGEVYKTANDYNILRSLTDITNINSDPDNTFMFFNNELPHGEVTPFLSEITVDMDLDAYYELASTNSNGNRDLLEAYLSNGIALELLGEWFDYLREQGVYDNTRIIIVADHGYNVNYLNNALFEDGYGIESYVPLLMYKDFNSRGFEVNYEFMTNADVPYLATLGLIDNSVNPYTGNLLVNCQTSDIPVRICYSHINDVNDNNGTTFQETDSWYTVSNTDDLFNIDNWYIVEN